MVGLTRNDNTILAKQVFLISLTDCCWLPSEVRPRSTTLKSTHAKGKQKGRLERERRRRS